MIYTAKLNDNLVYSGFGLGTLILLIICYFAIMLLLKKLQLNKFKAQEVSIYEDKLTKWVLLGTIISYVLLYVVQLILFILFVNNKTDGYVIASETIFLVDIVIAIVFLYLQGILQSSLIVITKNDSLITTSAIVKRSDIISIDTDNKRRKYIIEYRDDKIIGNIKELKIKYHWKLKDFLIDNNYLKK